MSYALDQQAIGYQEIDKVVYANAAITDLMIHGAAVLVM
jgi:hypothetical protein